MTSISLLVTLIEIGHQAEVFSITMQRVSSSGSTKKINSESSPCKREQESRKSSTDSAELPHILRLFANLLMTITLAITSCPTNLGTALRASVHINLPKLKTDKTKMDSIADQYFVQIRGIHGEHTESDDGVYDISNKRRLGRSEK